MADLTIAICTYNRAHFLRRALGAVIEQVDGLAPSGGVEILVVDNASTDETRAVVDALGPAVSYVREDRQGLSWARNRAMQNSRSSWILFLDDDAVPADGWVTAALRAIVDFPDAGAIGGPVLPDFVESPPPLLVDAFADARRGFCELRHDRDRGPLPAPLEIYGGNFAVHLTAARGLAFDTELGRRGRDSGLGEDTRFVLDLRDRGLTICWIPDMVVRHHVDPARMTLPYLLGYRRALGVSLGRMRRAEPGSEAALMGVPRWILRRQVESTARAVWELARGRRARGLEAIGDLEFYRGMADSARRQPSPVADRWAVRQLERWVMGPGSSSRG